MLLPPRSRHRRPLTAPLLLSSSTHENTQDAPLAGADPVAWYCFGVTHVVRPEDFPIMPCEVVGFALKPFGAGA